MRTKIVEVEWIDANSSGGWRTRETFMREAAPIVCRTVGYLVKHDKEVVAVAQTHDGEGGKIVDTSTIPMVCVRKIRTLR